MKKFLLTAAFACLTVISYGQEKPKEAKAHVCTEACDHGDKKEEKACCAEAKSEGKSCDHHGKEKTAKKEMACCKAAAAEGKECGKCAKKEVAATEPAPAKKSCCSEGKKSSCHDKAGTK